jgi:hypothetical protein
MKHLSPAPHRLTLTLGFWSAVGILITFLVYTLCFVAITFTAPAFTWTNLPDYLTYTASTNQVLKHVAQASMLLFGPLYLVTLNSIHDLAAPNHKTLTRLSLLYGALFTVLIAAHYFVQISAVRLQVAHAQTAGLEQFIQANAYGGLPAINMLGWSLFFGLSSLFAAPVFSGGRLERTLSIFFIINGVSCLLGGLGYVFEVIPLVFLCTTFIMGGAVTIIAVCLTRYFRRGLRALPPTS